MLLKNQDLGRQGRGCPEAELGKMFQMGCVGKRMTQESIPTAGRGIALLSQLLLSRGWVDTHAGACMRNSEGSFVESVLSLQS